MELENWFIKIGEIEILPEDIPRADIDRVSYCAIPIKLIFSQTNLIISTATSFFYKYNSKVYLITNWHNVTGINPITKEFLNDYSCQPDTLQFVWLAQKQPFIKRNRYNKKLYFDEEMTQPRWFIHPDKGNNVDVIALEIDIDGKEINAINDQDFDDFKATVADDVYILWFPYNLKGAGNFPLWKKWTIATEPDFSIDGLPKMLIDTASRPWMSGSPVIYRRRGIHNLWEDGMMKDDSIIWEIQGFVWIYSGRILWDTMLEAQLGIVRKKEVIEEIIMGEKFDDRSNFLVKFEKEKQWKVDTK